MKHLGILVAFILVVAGSLVSPALAQEYVPGQIIVKLKPGATSAVLSEVAAPGALSSAKAWKSNGAMLVPLADGVTVESAVALLGKDAGVAYAEPDWIQHAFGTPDDPMYSQQWGWDKIQAPAAWDLETGDPSIVVNVIDTGIDTDHPDLAANIWTNALEAAGSPGVDDDGNGYVDDIHGWNAVANNGNPEDNGIVAHGTHVSGTIGAVTNNTLGVAGANWSTSIIACKFLSFLGSGALSDAIECVDYIIATKENAPSGADIRVSSNSWGGGGFSAALGDAIQAATDAGILWVNAAGNGNQNNDCFGSDAYPSSFNVDGIISVASTTSTDAKSSFSTTGASTVDIGAPGSDILSTNKGDGYFELSGTSMACPHVAGVAALCLAANPALSLTQVQEAVLCNGDPISAMDGVTRTGMRLNAFGAVYGVLNGYTCSDRDSDGTPDYADNCPYDANDQTDSDGNGVGDACEPTDCGGCS